MATKSVAIVQSNYLPWKGYFDLIASVDEFILYDDMQFTKRDWRNRNLIKTPQGPQWITVPVLTKNKFHQRIDETVVNGHEWIDAHQKTIQQNYSRSPFFSEIFPHLQRAFSALKDCERLSDINRQLIEFICRQLGIKTPIRWSTEFEASGSKTERLVDLCKMTGATDYVSGPSARSYIIETLFHEAGIRLHYATYDHYSTYTQLYGEFVHNVSILDVMFNIGLEKSRDQLMMRGHFFEAPDV